MWLHCDVHTHKSAGTPTLHPSSRNFRALHKRMTFTKGKARLSHLQLWQHKATCTEMFSIAVFKTVINHVYKKRGLTEWNCATTVQWVGPFKYTHLAFLNSDLQQYAGFNTDYILTIIYWNVYRNMGMSNCQQKELVFQGLTAEL